MLNRPRLSVASALVAVALAVSASGCSEPDLSKALTVTEVFTGYYDDGPVLTGAQRGFNHLVPSIVFKLQNSTAQQIGSAQLLVSFWKVGDDGETDSRDVVGIDKSLAPGASTSTITVRATVGFNLQAPRAELFNQSLYKDFVVKVFAKRAGRIFPLGEFKIDRRIIPHAPTTP